MQEKDVHVEKTDDKREWEHYHLKVDLGQSLLRIDKYLSNRLENASRSKIQAAAEAGNIRVNTIPVKSNYKVKPGDDIQIFLDFPPRETEILPEEIPLSILFEDEHLAVIDKPAGLVVHPGHGNYTGTLVNALAHYYHDLPMFHSKDSRPGLVHRIDKDTSGLLVIAKNEKAKNKLASQFYRKTIQRKYQALVWGILKEKAGTITGNIGRNPSNRQIYKVFPEGEHGKNATTHFQIIEELGYVTLVECQLETGRTHQIRVHMKYLGHPVFNDASYGGDQILWGTTFTKYNQFVRNCFKIIPRQALHAKTLGFTHPATGEKMIFDSELPEDMKTVIAKWKNYIAHR
jgi:23S rRNA pseudouridine1911/1915/1917 synthase